MATNASFDITSPIDFQEVDNALNQARKEVGQRYDFKGARADIDAECDREDAHARCRRRIQDERAVGGRADAPGAARCAAQELQGRRLGAGLRRHGPTVIPIQEGIPIEAAREIVKFSRTRNSRRFRPHSGRPGPRDVALQRRSAGRHAALREHDFGVALHFGNYR